MPHPYVVRARAALLCAGLAAASAHAQQPAGAPALPEAKNWTAAQDHQQMMEQLGIKALRPGPSGNEQDANHANYDEAKANPFPKLPDVLTLKNGKKVTTREQWTQRRAEIVEDFRARSLRPRSEERPEGLVDGDARPTPARSPAIVSSANSSSATSTTRRIHCSASTSR